LRKTLYIIFLILSTVLTVFTVIDSLKGNSGTEDSLLKSVWVVFILAAYVLIQVICIFLMKPSFTLYKCGFYVLHIGIVLLLTGCFIYYISGDVVTVTVPVNEKAIYSEIKRTEPDSKGNDMLKLDFGIGVSDFVVEKYTAEDGVEGTDKYYEATLMILSDGERTPKEIPLIVNYPHHQNGWKIYLMNYDKITESSVQLMLKYDPGEYITLTGIWMLIIGTFVMCLFKKKGAGEKV